MQKNETNICKMTKIGQKMLFHAGMVEMMTKIWIIGVIVDLTR